MSSVSDYMAETTMDSSVLSNYDGSAGLPTYDRVDLSNSSGTDGDVSLPFQSSDVTFDPVFSDDFGSYLSGLGDSFVGNESSGGAMDIFKSLGIFNDKGELSKGGYGLLQSLMAGGASMGALSMKKDLMKDEADYQLRNANGVINERARLKGETGEIAPREQQAMLAKAIEKRVKQGRPNTAGGTATGLLAYTQNNQSTRA